MRFWRFIGEWFVTSVAIWVTTLIVPGIILNAFPTDAAWGAAPWNFLGPLAIVGLAYAIVNHTIGTIVRIIAIPFKILTLGIFALFVNGFLLWLTGELFSHVGWGLAITDFWAAFWGAIVLGILLWLLNLVSGRSERHNSH